MSSQRTFDHVHNFRDLADSSTSIAPGKIYRSASPAAASANDVEYLINTLKIKTLIDLRTEAESLSDDVTMHASETIYRHFKEEEADKHEIPDFFDWDSEKDAKKLRQEIKRLKSLQYEDEECTSRKLFRVPFINKMSMGKALFSAADASTKWKIVGTFLSLKISKGKALMVQQMDKQGLTGLNKIIIQGNPAPIAHILRILCDKTAHPVLINCSHGKDRTGLMCGIILMALGASIEEVASDYHISEAHGTTEEAVAIFKKRSPLLTLDHWTKAPKHVMIDTMKFIDESYGSLQEYLTSIGFDLGWQERLRKVLKHEPMSRTFAEVVVAATHV